METETNYDDQYNVPEPIQPQFEDYFEILGDTSGGMGKVYFCKNKRFGNLYALKQAQPEENKRQIFEQEAAFALELGKHPNIVYTHSVGGKKDIYYLIMELVASKNDSEDDRPHGNTLKDEFNRRAEGIDPETGFKWAIAFCEGMAYLNGKGMTAHKDIKPENIFITPNGTLKIGDFGLAGLSAKKAAGTRGYRAPEVKDGNFSVRSDIYAFGVVLYQLFNKGYNPTEPTYYTKAGTRMNDQDAQFPQPEDIRSHCAERIIRKCMALNPAERYGSFKELQADLIQELKNIVSDYEYHAPEEGTMSAEDCFQKAFGWSNLKDYDRAIRWNTQAIEVDPKYAKAYYNRGIAYRKLQEYDKAIADYTQAIELDPKFSMAYNNRGHIYYALKEYNKAIADYTKAIEVDPKYAKAYYNRGIAYRKLQEYDKAIADYTQAIELDPKFSMAYNNRGHIYYALKEYNKAIADYTKAIEVDPKYAKAYYNRGIAYRKLQEYDKAIADYTQTIELDSKFAVAYNNLIALYNQLNKPEEAKKWEALKKKNCPESDQ
ncbi:MAG: tetratricopeptide repeat protein [Candidatus Avelusimicrobium sp.]|uniref:tetratricopeptide repeat protein n=1 Tax=Candidatus Avelusimicrobium sp. TaxID=3048833 RepID=UPI003F083720